MFLQYELWKDCKFGCGFCSNKFIAKKRNKKESLEYVIKSLKSKIIPSNSSIGFTGGEFFDGQLSDPEVKKLFYEVLGLTISKLGPTGRLMICTALMSKDKTDWFEFCDFIQAHDYETHTLVCTSYDRLYRFNDTTKQIWNDTFQETRQKYPKLNLHVEMILTQDLVETVINDPLYLKRHAEEWGTSIHFNIPALPYYSELHKIDKVEFNKRYPKFFPNRKDFLKLISMRVPEFDMVALADHRFHSTEIHYCLNDINWIIVPEREKMPTTCLKQKICDNCCCYVDSPRKMQDDLKAFLEATMS